jgi:nitric oxide reductase subunit B
MSTPKKGFIHFLLNPRNWWIPLTVILIVSFTGVSIIGYETYYKAPPIPDYVNSSGKIILSHDEILEGQSVFQHYALMEYGTMFGDGATRGPDFTAEALHQFSLHLQDYFKQNKNTSALEEMGVEENTKRIIKQNNYNAENNQVQFNEAQEYAYAKLVDYYIAFFKGNNEHSFKPNGYISDETEIRQLAAFFYWGSWVCGVERPGANYSYTHNWPYDPTAGNTPTTAVIVWTILGSFGLILGLGIVLYYHGRLEKLDDHTFTGNAGPLMSNGGVTSFVPTPAQRATYKYFYVAVLLFLIQVLSGILTVHDFVGLTRFFGVDLQQIMPVTITRSWHVQLSLLWISTCWIGASLFVTPILNPAVKATFTKHVNLIFYMIVLLGAGAFVGMYIGPKGMIDSWYWLGHQGWEFVEPGKVWQGLLFLIFAAWGVTLYKGLKPVLKISQPYALPNWLVYTTFSILLLLISGFVATPKTNFVIADFWRWCVIHMWAEAFFEVFTTVLVGYFMVLMGLVSRDAAVRVIYLATLLFLGSGLLGISHNFYWNAKPVATMALGSVFSTLQVIPLVLLTLEAWRFQKLPGLVEEGLQTGKGSSKHRFFGMPEVFMFLVAVNFWNFFGAGVLGFIINLPLANYFEHGTYLTVNHGHAALMGVYGNLSIAAILFCCQLLTRPEEWKGKILRVTFWSINVGLMLMVLLDLFPAGIHQFNAVAEHGLWYARSAEFIQGTTFQTLTWMRIVGGSIFTLGGVIPLAWVVLRTAAHLKSPHYSNNEKISPEPILSEEEIHV